MNLSKIRTTTSPFLLFLPFLALYILIALVFHKSAVYGDEVRYFTFAQRLTHGYYSLPEPDVNISNGPGYPLVLMPFVALGCSTLFLGLLNALFYYFSVVFVYKTLRILSSEKLAFWFSLFWACYFNAYQEIPYVLTEPFTSLMTSLVMYYLVKAYFPGDPSKTKKYVIIAGVLLGYLVLTKIIFGYVLMAMVVATVIMWLLKKHSETYRKGMLISVIGLAVTVPYLIYTFSLTGKAFYWGSSGGDSLYWMSTPYEGEFGDWNTYPRMPKDDDATADFAMDSTDAHHKADFDHIYSFGGSARDDEFKKYAIRNIKEHPGKFIQNCISNLGRVFFSVPNSYTLQSNKNLLRLPMSGFVLLLSIFSLIATVLNWGRVAYPFRYVLFILMMYFGLTMLVSAATRMLTVIMPILLAWNVYILYKTVQIRLSFNKDPEEKN